MGRGAGGGHATRMSVPFVPCLPQATPLFFLVALSISQIFSPSLFQYFYCQRDPTGSHLLPQRLNIALFFTEIKLLSMHFQGESNSCIHLQHRGLRCMQWGTPADAGPGLDQGGSLALHSPTWACPPQEAIEAP